MRCYFACALALLVMTIGEVSTAAAGGAKDWLLEEADGEPARARVSADGRDLTLENGLVRRSWKLDRDAACWSMEELRSGGEFIRSVRPEALLEIDGVTHPVGGLENPKDHSYIDPAWFEGMKPGTNALLFTGFELEGIRAPYAWRPRFGVRETPWPPKGQGLALHFAGNGKLEGLRVSAHYELYDGAPVFTKWLSISNGTAREIVLDKITCEQIAAPRSQMSRLHAEADYTSFRVFPIRWELDPQFRSDSALNFHEYFLGESVHYYPTEWLDNLWAVPPEQTQGKMEGGSRSLMSSRYPFGPGRHLKPGETFQTYRTFLLLQDSDDRTRQSLARRKMFRLLAPQTQENPIFFHLIRSDSESIRKAVDQCAELGFEMLILSYGSGFNMNTEDPAEIARYKADFDYAHGKGIKIGGYILFASSASHGTNDAVGADGKLGSEYGRSVCLGTAYSDDYFKTLFKFIERTGMDVIEADGPYHGYSCSATNHLYHRGKEDSYHVNWERQCEFFRGCLERGVYIHTPDYYFFNGANRSSLGYRESATYLPHWIKVMVARRNIYDGTVNKSPSMGWMWDPLAPGGGPLTEMNPLREHLDLYNWHLGQIFGSGVMACWRNTVLYDDDRSKALVRQWVEFFKKHREVASSDILQLRYPDGRGLDYFLHVNPRGPEKGLLMVFNPLDHAVKETIPVPLYYAGLGKTARFTAESGKARREKLDSRQTASLEVSLEAKAFTWFIIE